MSESPPDVSLAEHDERELDELPRADAEAIEDLRVADTEATPLSVAYDRRDGALSARLHSGSAVGTVRLPSGRRVTVTPKETVGRLLWLLAYAHDTPAPTLSTPAELGDGAQFHRVLAVLFERELQTVLARGVDQTYTDREGVWDQIRGRLDRQRQLRRPTGPTPTTFAVDYRAATTGTTLNRVVAVAARRLRRLLAHGDGIADGTATRTDQIAARLTQTARAFRDRIDGSVPRTVPPDAVERIELSRLTDHYDRLLALTRTVLLGAFFDDLQPGDRRARALFVDMNALFERVVERATRAAVADRPYTVLGQETLPALVQGPHGGDTVRPDVVVARERDASNNGGDGGDVPTPADRAVAVVDAKWKPGGVSGRDATQMAGYCLVTEAPGVFALPATDDLDDAANAPDEPSIVASEHEIHSCRLPTNEEPETLETYTEGIEAAVADRLAAVLDEW